MAMLTYHCVVKQADRAMQMTVSGVRDLAHLKDHLKANGYEFVGIFPDGNASEAEANKLNASAVAPTGPAQTPEQTLDALTHAALNANPI